MKLGVMTGGGDCPGLNAVIRAVVRGAAFDADDVEILGIEDGFDGLVSGRGVAPLTLPMVRGIHSRGGTILGTSNRGNPFEYPCKQADGTVEYRDISDECVARMGRLGLDGLIVIGGDGTLSIAHDLALKGVNVVGVPKTIDNDLQATDYTFGFDSAVNVCMEALDRLKTTAESHDRMMIMEVMGRYAGHIALDVAVAGGAHVVLIPEIPYDIEAVRRHIRARQAGGGHHHLVVVAEGAKPLGGDYAYDADVKASAGALQRLGGAAVRLAVELEPLEIETRCLVLGHLQRGGSPTYRDRMLGTAFGAHAYRLAREGRWDRMVCLSGAAITDAPLTDAISAQKLVDTNGDLVQTARIVGLNLGD